MSIPPIKDGRVWIVEVKADGEWYPADYLWNFTEAEALADIDARYRVFGRKAEFRAALYVRPHNNWSDSK